MVNEEFIEQIEQFEEQQHFPMKKGPTGHMCDIFMKNISKRFR